MAALTAARFVDTKKFTPELGAYVMTYDVIASDIIYKGAFVIEGTSGVKPADGAAGAHVLGIAKETVDNASGAAGDKQVEVIQGAVIVHTIAGATFADIGNPVYASDDQTLTQTKGTNDYVGSIIGFRSATEVLVKMDLPVSPGTALTAKDTATVDATYGSEEQGVIDNNRTRIEEIETALKRVGILP